MRGFSECWHFFFVGHEKKFSRINEKEKRMLVQIAHMGWENNSSRNKEKEYKVQWRPTSII